MGQFLGRAKHPKTGKVRTVLLIDDHFGPNRMGVKFSEKEILPESVVDIISGGVAPVFERKRPKESVFRGPKADKRAASDLRVEKKRKHR